MGCGPGVGGALMDDLIYPRLWLVEDENKEHTGQQEDHDIRKLFPNKKGKKTGMKEMSNKGTSEWLAMSVGVFFIGALFTIASYQVYSTTLPDQFSNVEIHDDGGYDKLADAEENALPDDVKLPTNIVPISYKLYLNVSVLTKRYNGVITIEIKCLNDTNQIVLHSKHHKVNKTILRYGDKELKPVNIRRYNEKLTLSFKDNLIAGSTYKLLLSFYSDLGDRPNYGIYISQYIDGDGKKHNMVSYDFQPTRARYAFPCFDEPALRAIWRIILHPEENDYHALSNMPVDKIVHLDDGTKEIFFITTPPISSYLVNFAFTQYEYRETVSAKGVPIRVYAPIGRLNETIMPLKYAAFAVDYFADKFGISYALPKLDLFPVTKFSSSGDESWGNIIFSETSLLLNPETSSQYSYKFVCGVIAHKISHQWFGDLVSINWWNDLWLKESFAEYVETLPVAIEQPEWDKESALFHFIMSGIAFDSSNYAQSIAASEIEPKKLGNNYDDITYKKGAAIISMLARYLGEEKFFQGLEIYLKRFRYKSALPTDLWEAMSEVSGTVHVVGMMKTWVNYAGFPLVTVKRVDNKLVFEQEKFVFKHLTISPTNESVDSTIWHVPIKIKICGKEIQYMLTDRRGELKLHSNCDPSKAYKVNLESSGYYHVHYIDDNWQKLMSLFHSDHELLHPVDRAGLLYDLNSLVRFNHLDIIVALNFTKYLHKEFNPQAWGNGLSLLSEIRHVFYNTALKKIVEDYTLRKMTPVLNDLLSLRHHNHKQIQLMRMLLDVAVLYGMKILPTELENIFLRWVVKNGTTNLPKNIRYQIIHAGIFNGNTGAFNFVNDTRVKTNSVIERQSLMMALSYTKNKELLKRMVSEAIEKVDIDILSAVCRNRHGRLFAFKALEKHWEVITDKYKVINTGLVRYTLSSCLNGGTTEADKKEAEAFLTSGRDLGRWKVHVQRAVEKIQHNIVFVARYEKDIKYWFANYASTEDNDE